MIHCCAMALEERFRCTLNPFIKRRQYAIYIECYFLNENNICTDWMGVDRDLFFLLNCLAKPQF